jgi:hypothetical protein
MLVTDDTKWYFQTEDGEEHPTIILLDIDLVLFIIFYSSCCILMSTI